MSYPLSISILEITSQTHPEMYQLGDSRSNLMKLLVIHSLGNNMGGYRIRKYGAEVECSSLEWVHPVMKFLMAI